MASFVPWDTCESASLLISFLCGPPRLIGSRRQCCHHQLGTHRCVSHLHSLSLSDSSTSVTVLLRGNGLWLAFTGGQGLRKELELALEVTELQFTWCCVLCPHP